eukprot:scaffold3072_cov116-Isochrysis_galbana.AAC.7
MIPLPWRERGIQFPQHKSKHTSQAHGDMATRQGRHKQGGGKRNLHLVFRGRWISARGPSHTPFGGVRNLASCEHIQAMWGHQLGPTIQLTTHTPTSLGDTPRRGEKLETSERGERPETSERDERLEDEGGNEGGREWNIVTCWRDRQTTDDAVHNSSFTGLRGCVGSSRARRERPGKMEFDGSCGFYAGPGWRFG